MQLRSDSFEDGAPIPAEFAFGKRGDDQPCVLSSNRNPHLAWSDAPAGTRSVALACIDVDVPSRGDDVNREGRTVSADLPRVDFAHWLMIDIPPDCNEIAAAACSDGITPHGMRDPNGPTGSLPMRKCRLLISATTARARPGTMRACTTISSGCTRWTWRSWICPMTSTGSRCNRRCAVTSSRKRVASAPTLSTRRRINAAATCRSRETEILCFHRARRFPEPAEECNECRHHQGPLEAIGRAPENAVGQIDGG